jgi:hypothetical protein
MSSEIDHSDSYYLDEPLLKKNILSAEPGSETFEDRSWVVEAVLRRQLRRAIQALVILSIGFLLAFITLLYLLFTSRRHEYGHCSTIELFPCKSDSRPGVNAPHSFALYRPAIETVRDYHDTDSSNSNAKRSLSHSN